MKIHQNSKKQHWSYIIDSEKQVYFLYFVFLLYIHYLTNIYLKLRVLNAV